jgi:hypothetical protein
MLLQFTYNVYMHVPLRQGYKRGRSCDIENWSCDFSHEEA